MAPIGRTHPTLRYTLLRFGLFVVAVVVLRLLVALGVLPLDGASGGVVLLGLAVLISAPLSYLLLGRQRDAMAAAISARVARIRDGIDASARSEDEDEDPSRSANHAAGA